MPLPKHKTEERKSVEEDLVVDRVVSGGLLP
jgi:hypothetical protein